MHSFKPHSFFGVFVTQPFASTPNSDPLSISTAQPVITSMALYLASWTWVSPCQSIWHTAGRLTPAKSRGFLDDSYPSLPFLSPSNLNHFFFGFQSLAWPGPTPHVQSCAYYSPAHVTSYLYCQALVMLSGYVPVEISFLTLAFSKHSHLLAMEPSLVL